jgi:hypothetical protein
MSVHACAWFRVIVGGICPGPYASFMVRRNTFLMIQVEAKGRLDQVSKRL